MEAHSWKIAGYAAVLQKFRIMHLHIGQMQCTFKPLVACSVLDI